MCTQDSKRFLASVSITLAVLLASAGQAGLSCAWHPGLGQARAVLLMLILVRGRSLSMTMWLVLPSACVLLCATSAVLLTRSIASQDDGALYCSTASPGFKRELLDRLMR